MLRAASHLVLATADVSAITRFFAEAFDIVPAFENDMFSEFVLPSKFRIAFFVPVGASAKTFDAGSSRAAGSIGLTVDDVDVVYGRIRSMQGQWPCNVSGPPKDHPWGERSFLLTDPDGNRWEITRAPSPDGLLVDHGGLG
jgi:uncharacterized glyoxalase superfamily protein PhnB